MKRGFQSLEISQVTWEIPHRYSRLHPIVFGVCSAFDAKLNRKVAIKKLSKPEIHAKRTYREVQMLKHMNHENIVCLIDVFTPNENLSEFSDVYLVTPKMGADLNNVMKSNSLTDDHVQYFIYQILRALKYLHSANICHRDLKPSKIAVNEDCELKILDLGLAPEKDNEMMGFEAITWYRAPEIIFNWMHHNDNVDVWSVGCIMGELLTGQPLFPWVDPVDHLMRIMEITGKPPDEFMEKINSEEVKSFINQLKPMSPKPLKDVFVGASDQALSLLQKMLSLDPDCRITAEDALKHPYLSQYHDPSDEPDAEPYEDEYEHADFPVGEWKRLVWAAMQDFTPKLDSLD